MIMYALIVYSEQSSGSEVITVDTNLWKVCQTALNIGLMTDKVRTKWMPRLKKFRELTDTYTNDWTHTEKEQVHSLLGNIDTV